LKVGDIVVYIPLGRSPTDPGVYEILEIKNEVARIKRPKKIHNNDVHTSFLQLADEKEIARWVAEKLK
jgi:hypothetical protein